MADKGTKPVQIDEPMKEWLAGAATALKSDPVYAFLQGFPFTGFVYVDGNGATFPPGFTEAPQDWKLYWDVRVFAGGSSEWHAWKDGRNRFWHRAVNLDDWRDPEPLERDHPLWGTKRLDESVQDPAKSWTCFSEANGTRIWLPMSWQDADPPRLRMYSRIARDEKTGLAYIDDAMIQGFVPKKEKSNESR